MQFIKKNLFAIILVAVLGGGSAGIYFLSNAPKADVAEAIQTWNSRVRIRKLNIVPDLEQRTLTIVMSYDILAARNRSAVSLNEQVQLNLRLAG